LSAVLELKFLLNNYRKHALSFIETLADSKFMADQDTNREAAFVADRVTERIEHRRVVRAQPDRISEDSFQDDPHQGMNAAGVAGMTAVLQDILASLQTIEQSLNGQREETASLRAVLEANAKSEKGGMRARKVTYFRLCFKAGLGVGRKRSN
jgi:hypothetical protein